MKNFKRWPLRKKKLFSIVQKKRIIIILYFFSSPMVVWKKTLQKTAPSWVESKQPTWAPKPISNKNQSCIKCLNSVSTRGMVGPWAEILKKVVKLNHTHTCNLQGSWVILEITVPTTRIKTYIIPAEGLFFHIHFPCITRLTTPHAHGCVRVEERQWVRENSLS